MAYVDVDMDYTRHIHTEHVGDYIWNPTRESSLRLRSDDSDLDNFDGQCLTSIDIAGFRSVIFQR